MSCEVEDATAEKSVRLRLLGSTSAGDEKDIRVEPGAMVRILMGARIPVGADAVVSEEFTKRESNNVIIQTFAETGRNILHCGEDVAFRNYSGEPPALPGNK